MPDFEIEDSLNCMVAGVDEAGRGAMGRTGGGRSRDYS